MTLATVGGAPAAVRGRPAQQPHRHGQRAAGLIDAPGAFVDPNLPAGLRRRTASRPSATASSSPTPSSPRRPGRAVPRGPRRRPRRRQRVRPRGNFLARIASPGGVLNAPWGTAPAHPNFGAYGGDLLIGNFGDGRINAFHENADGTWTNSGFLKNLAGDAARRSAACGRCSSASATPTAAQRNHLYYTAGPFGETQGVLGRIMPNPGDVSRHRPGDAVADARHAGRVRRVHAGRRQGLHGRDDRDRDLHRGRRDADRRRPSPRPA